MKCSNLKLKKSAALGEKRSREKKSALFFGGGSTVLGFVVGIVVFLVALDELGAANDEKAPYNTDGEQHGDDTCDSHDEIKGWD